MEIYGENVIFWKEVIQEKYERDKKFLKKDNYIKSEKSSLKKLDHSACPYDFDDMNNNVGLIDGKKTKNISKLKARSCAYKSIFMSDDGGLLKRRNLKKIRDGRTFYGSRFLLKKFVKEPK